MSTEPFLRRVKLWHYKSIAECDVELQRLTLLVGRNGSGKSNFLDAIRFVAEGLETSLDHALKSRGGIGEVRRRSTGHPHNFAMELELNLPNWQVATYAFEISAREKGGFRVKSESLKIVSGTRIDAEFDVSEGKVAQPGMPPAAEDRFYLVTASSLPQFRGVYDALLAMGFYNLNPAEIKELQSPDAGELLHRDGRNIASVVARMAEDRPELKERIRDYLQQIVPDVSDFSRSSLGPRETLEFRQQVKGAKHPWTFYAASMSDGTLRALGILVAAMQRAHRRTPVRLIGIEEPETALHPAAAGALMDSLKEAAEHTQIIVTTHSPDLLDQIDSKGLLIVLSQQGTTQIGRADKASRDAIEKHLYTPGELLRMDQLQPEVNGHQIKFAFANSGSAE
jgi:predicted ATPase